MTDVLAILDAGPLIVFHQIDRLELLQRLFDYVVAPPAVAREIGPSLGTLPPWVTERRPASIPNMLQGLDPGEREAIALAAQLGADAIVLDDLAARRAARQLGLKVIGSAGLLVQGRVAQPQDDHVAEPSGKRGVRDRRLRLWSADAIRRLRVQSIS